MRKVYVSYNSPHMPLWITILHSLMDIPSGVLCATGGGERSQVSEEQPWSGLLCPLTGSSSCPFCIRKMECSTSAKPSHPVMIQSSPISI